MSFLSVFSSICSLVNMIKKSRSELSAKFVSCGNISANGIFPNPRIMTNLQVPVLLGTFLISLKVLNMAGLDRVEKASPNSDASSISSSTTIWSWQSRAVDLRRRDKSSTASNISSCRGSAAAVPTTVALLIPRASSTRHEATFTDVHKVNMAGKSVFQARCILYPRSVQLLCVENLQSVQ